MADVKTFTCNLCDAMCGLHVTLEAGRITDIRGNPDDVFSRGHICPKGPALRELYDDPDRLRTPLRRTKGGFEPIAWDDAMGEIATRLRALRREHGKDAVGYYVGNPVAHSYRAALGVQLLQTALGTRSRFDANSQDGNPRLFACMQMYGDAMAMPVPDIDRIDLLIMLGADPAVSNGSMMGLGDVRARLRGVRERGGRLVVFDPRRTETVEAYATEHHAIRPGGDAALLLAMLHVLFQERRLAPVDATGLLELRDAAAPFSPERVAPAIDIAAEVIRALARDLAATPRAAVYSRVGTSQSEFGPLVTWLCEALNVVTGHLDREGGVLFPSPAADIGGLARLLIGNEYGRWRSRVRGLPELLGALPSAAMAEEMETPGDGQIRALICVAGNPVLSTPNGPRLGRALAGLEYMVSVDLYLNETSRHAHIVLPPAHIFEAGNYDLLLLPLAVRNFVKVSPPILDRGPDTRDDWEILSELAVRLALPNVGWLRRMCLRLAASVPDRLLDLLLRNGPYHLTLKQVRAAPDGIDLGPLTSSGGAHLRTNDRRVNLAPAPLLRDLPRLEAWLDAPRPPLVLIGRRHLRCDNSWLHNLPSLARGKDRTALLVHPSDAERLGLGARATATSRVGTVDVTVEVTEAIRPGVVSLPHGYGHAEAHDTLSVAARFDAPSANVLTDEGAVEPIIGTSILNGVPITLSPRA